MVKKYRWERLTASRVVSPSPVNVATIIVTADDSAQGKATFYDGESASDPQIILIKTGSGQSTAVNFPFLLSTLRGLYVSFTASVTEVLVCYEVEKE